MKLVNGGNEMKKKLITTLILAFMLLALISCSKKDSVTNIIQETNNDESLENAIENAEKAETKVEVAGWSIDILDHRIDTSMENVSVVLGYTEVGTNTFTKTAEEGNEFCLVKLNIEKVDSMEEIEWDKFLLIDDLGNSYTRMEDSFLSDLGMKRMSGTDLNFGSNEGWIAYEVKAGYSNLKLQYEFTNETYEYNLLGESDVIQANTQLVPVFEDYLEEQKKVDDNLLAEAEKGYTIDNPLIVVNPYGISPLSAVVIFDTDKETTVNLTVKGKKSQDDIITTFDRTTSHSLPIYGLYPGGTTQVVFTLEDGTEKTVEITTDQLDTDLIKGEVTTIKDAEYDFSKLTFVSVTGSDDGYGVIAYDSSGDMRLALKGTSFPVERLKNGNIMLPSTRIIHAPYYSSGLLEMDLCGKVYNDYVIPGGYHHDFLELDNGNFLVLSNPIDFSTVEDRVYEIDRETGEVVYELDLTTILDPSDGGSINRTEEDWFHNNAICYDAATDSIILSGRHADAVVSINKTNKTLNWILGDPNGWESVDKSKFFTPVGDNFEWQYAQHNVSLLPNGDLMLFDNGAGRTKVGAEDKKVTGDDVYSRAVIYHIDTENMTIEQVWQYGKERGAEWYSSYISGTEYLGENNIWITSGGTLYDTEKDTYDLSPTNQADSVKSSHINQVKNGELVYELLLDCESYRSIRLPIYPEDNNLDFTKYGKYLGTLGKTPTISIADFDLNTAVTADFTINVIQNPDRFLVSGSWAQTAEDAAVILRRSDGVVSGYSISQPANNANETDEVSFNTWFSPVGLEDDSYDIYICNNGIIYNTGYTIK